MGEKRCCGARTLLYVVASLQLVSTAERQVFDFLGYMWVPIGANFLNFVFVILGIFGIYQYHTRYTVTYLAWMLVWSAWNAFVVSLYMEAGDLDKSADSDLLSFGTGSYSWWLVNGFGCRPEYFLDNSTLAADGDGGGGGVSTALEGPADHRPVRPVRVTGCVLDYEYVEVTHASIQIVLAVFGLAIGGTVAHFYVTVVDRSRRKKSSPANHDKSNGIYSIEYGTHRGGNNGTRARNGTIDAGGGDLFGSSTGGGQPDGGGDNKGHMTPRRVKRRSYTRSSSRSASKAMTSNKSSHHHRSSTRSYGGRTGSSNRNSGGKAGGLMNPVNRLIDDQQRLAQRLPPFHTPYSNVDSSTSNDDTRNAMVAAERVYGQINPGFQNSRPNSLVYNQPLDSSAAGGSEDPSQKVAAATATRGAGTLVNSTDYDTSRPPSALTSYSNFHGLRRPLLPQQQQQHQQQQKDQPQSIPMKTLNSGGLHQEGGGDGSGQSSSNQVRHNMLTQESFMQPQVNLNRSFDDDDLPLPPPPLSSSPAPPQNMYNNRGAVVVGGGNSDNVNDGILMSQVGRDQPELPVPVPLQRTMPGRRSQNEYVNMPVQQQQQQQQQLVPARPSETVVGQPQFVVNHGAEVNGGMMMMMPNHRPMVNSLDPGKQPNGDSNASSGGGGSSFGRSNPNVPPAKGHHHRLGEPQTVAPVNGFSGDGSSNKNNPSSMEYGDTQTLRADEKMHLSISAFNQKFEAEQQQQLYQQEQQPPQQRHHITIDYNGPTNGVITTKAQSARNQQDQVPARQVGNGGQPSRQGGAYPDGVRPVQKAGPAVPLYQNQPPPDARRGPLSSEGGGGSSRIKDSRASMRAKHKKDMDDKVRQQQRIGGEDDYGFAVGAAAGTSAPMPSSSSSSTSPTRGPSSSSQQQQRFYANQDLAGLPVVMNNGMSRQHVDHGRPLAAGYPHHPQHHPQHQGHLYNNHNSHINGGPAEAGGPFGQDQDGWYSRDPMKPVGSSQHGGNCKCYRCQRKLTAI